MTGAAVRAAREDDLPSLLDLYRHLHPNEPPPDPARAATAWKNLIHSGLTAVLVVEDGGQLAASCTLAIVPNLTRGAHPYAVIENVVTHEAHRRKGLGQAVLAAALERAWAAGCYKVVLATGSRQEGTLRFYESAGFVRGGKTYFEMRRP